MSPFYNFTPVIPDNVKDIEYPTLKELVEEFVQHYGNKSEEEFDASSWDDESYSITFLFEFFIINLENYDWNLIL